MPEAYAQDTEGGSGCEPDSAPRALCQQGSCLWRDWRAENGGHEIDEVAGEESVVSAPRTLRASREFDEHDASRCETAVEWIDGEWRHFGFDHRAPAVEATGTVLARDGIDARSVTVDQLRNDTQVGSAPISIREFLRGWQYECGREPRQVALAIFCDLVEKGMATRFDRGLVFFEDRANEAGSILEVILERGCVSLIGLAVDLAQ
jgi:hypothetical protein